MKKNTVCIAWLWLLALNQICAQELVYKHFTTNDGVASSQVYMTLQDSKGYLWFATDQGVNRYDGNEFKTYASTNEIADNTIFTLYEDYKGRIWLCTYTKGLFYIENDSIKEYEFNKKLVSKLTKGSWVNSLHLDSADNLWLAMFNEPRWMKITEHGEINIYGSLLSEKEYGFIRKQFKNGEVVTTNYGIHEKGMPEIPHIKKDGNGNYFANRGLYRKQGILPDSSYIASDGDKYLYHIKDTLILKATKLSADVLIYQIDADRLGNVWVGTSKGVFFYENGDIGNPNPLCFLHGIGVSSVFQDREGGYWITTLDEGIFFIPVRAFTNHLPDFENKKSRITAIEGSKDKLWLGSFNGAIYSIDSNNILKQHSEIEYKAPKSLKYKPINDIISINQKVYFSNSICINSKGEILPLLGLSTDQTIKEAIGQNMVIKSLGMRLDSAQLIIGGNSGALIQGDEMIFATNTSPLSTQDMGVYAMLELQPNIFWIGAKLGVYELNMLDTTLTYLGNKNPLLSRRVRKMIFGPNESVILGTKGNGVVIKHHNKTWQIDEKKGLSSDIVASLLLQNDSTLWVGGPKGLNRVIFDIANPNDVQIEHYTINDGLLSNEIIDLAMFQNQVYIANDKALLSFTSDRLKTNKTPPALNIIDIEVNNKKVSYQDSYQLESNQNNISISYQAISPRSGKEISYKYRLVGRDTAWEETKEQNIQFTNLEGGNYRFEVIATNKDGYSTPEPISIVFNIATHFTQTWWFSVLKLLGIILFVGTVFYYRYYRFKQKNEIEKNVLKARFTALLSQMNPHFLFNSLASIQRYIVDNDQKNANYYLSKFSVLVRQVLENSEKGIVLIEDELEQLRSYLELEKLRFRGQFDYRIDIDDELDIWGYKMPTMILQPFIENAIWHGLAHRLEGGLLSISLKPTSTPERIEISIEDNGIGRLASQKMNANSRKGHNSIGLKNVEERIKLINSLHRIQMAQYIEDLYDEQNNPAGTRVVICLNML